MALIPIVSLAYLEENDRMSIRRRIIRPKRINSFDLPENEFVKLFRLNKTLCEELIERLRPALEPISSRRNVFSVETKVLTSLRFFATGADQKNIAQDIACSMSQQSISNIVNSVSRGINDLLFYEKIKFPVLRSEIEMNKKEFYDYCGFPGVVGALDCTHVAILPPHDSDQHNEKNYVNRKGFHSINVQIVSDLNLNILSICARFPGSVHDAYIWRASRLRDWFVDNFTRLKDTWLLGDSGYGLEPWLMVPFPNISTPEEENFNVAHARGRCCVERLNGVLKNRFRCLTKKRALYYSPETACSIINACAVLHNMCNAAGLEYNIIPDEDEDDLPFDTGLSNDSSKNASLIRLKLAEAI